MDKNLLTYNSKSVVKWYEDLTEITAAEKTIFNSYARFLSEADVLDIGIGGGRTTAFLHDKCKSYTGVDYSNEFVNSCKQKFPGLRIELADARNLTQFRNNSFDFVNFSFNGIDYSNLEGRQKILSEINRVLKPKGVFFFSTHNKNHSSFYKNPWTIKENGFMINLKTFVKLLPFLLRKLKNRKKEQFLERYAIINDFAHNYTLMTFYTSPELMEKQLKENNFTEIQFFSKAGVKTDKDHLDDWIFITCVKNGV